MYLKKSIKDKIINELIDLGITMQGNGLEYWLELLLAEYNGKFKHPNMMYRYEYLAKKYKSTTTRIERVLRHEKIIMEKRIREKYGVKTKITNESIILLFKLKIF